MSVPYQAVLLIAFGGPTSRDEIRPFLARVLKGIPIPPQRVEEVAHHYEAVGGKSPLNEITERQAKALERMLRQQGLALPVYVGMRNSAPFFADTLRQMAEDGVKKVLGFILSSHKTEASWERYQKNIADARAELGGHAPEVDYCGGWHDHPLFIQSWAERIETTFAELPAEKRPATPLIFTAHSLPASMAARSSYVADVQATARLIATALGHDRHGLAYQSRSGKPSDPWLEPDINEAIRKIAQEKAKDVVVAPIGFVCDHVEVLYDLDIETKQNAAACGVRLLRAGCPNDHPTFVKMMVQVITAAVDKSLQAPS
ncbi:MAG: ferrochelatase [Deltaproteobacteria bacterium]|jgi:protoporphyrin/coproporphyrin ferrochelatase